MRKILLQLAIIVLAIVFIFLMLRVEHKTDMENVVKSVCLTSGYDNWYKVVHNQDGTYTAWCFNYEWDTIHFEM